MPTIQTPPPVSAEPNLKRRQIIAASALAAAATALRPSSAMADSTPEWSRDEEAIHQERAFKAERQKVYEALTVESQFDRIIQLSGVMKANAMAKMQRPTKLGSRPGEEFALFGGYIVGRQLELVPNDLLVQAWREVSWRRGVYSIARFELTEEGGLTKLTFDHTGFPKGQAEHLASGWQEHYWDPLTKFLA